MIPHPSACRGVCEQCPGQQFTTPHYVHRLASCISERGAFASSVSLEIPAFSLQSLQISAFPWGRGDLATFHHQIGTRIWHAAAQAGDCVSVCVKVLAGL